MDDDYIELTDPDEVIREGDEFVSYGMRAEVPSADIGKRIRDMPRWKYRRPRSTVIRDAAIELLRAVYGVPMLPGVESVWPEAKTLREALGLTIEELGGDA